MPGIAAALAAALSTLERAGFLTRTDLGVTLTATGREMPAPATTRPVTFHVGADLALLVPRG